MFAPNESVIVKLKAIQFYKILTVPPVVDLIRKLTVEEVNANVCYSSPCGDAGNAMHTCGLALYFKPFC